ncbi:MAG: long-chain fatty acid--CoA ligase [Bacteroidales bacterium]|nr:long-chain fatty acid--CoA ligase [Bacteroidales bacterium]MDD4670728.1 long-chain fatty acid--CoA ligase [Bacteroidales bacterium]
MEIIRTFDLLTNLKASFPPKDDILARKIHGKWIKYSIDDYIEYSYNVAYGLLALGYREGTKIITLCNNRPEWNFIDMGSNLAKMVHIPVYSTLSHDDYTHIFNHSDAEIIIIGNINLYTKVRPVIEEITRPVKVILMDDSTELYCMSQLYQLGRDNKDKFAPVVEKNKQEIGPDDLATIIYTSGTTGTPKGVMLSHYNMMSNSHGHAIRQTKNSSHRMVSFLPLCHIYERTMNYEYQELCISIYYAESLATIATDLADCHADGFCGVPRVLEMMYSKLESAGKAQKGFKRIVYNWAWNFANNFDNYNTHKLYLAKQRLADKLVYSKWREKFGGHEMLVVSGGSSIQAKIVRTFNAAKLHIFEGYGMTETSPVIAVNSPADGYNIIGTVGKPMGGTELKFAEDGEILTRGPHVMLGYYKDPEYTKQVIDEEGFLHTGDIGTLVDGKYLKITDRKKEIFKLSAGKYIAPQAIENLLKNSPLIDNCIVIGENQKFASAIIVPHIAALKEIAARQKIAYKDDDDLITKEPIIKRMHKEVEAVNSKLAAHEAIKFEKLVNDEWSVANNMLSQTLKLKRSPIHKKYAALINTIYKIDTQVSQ